MSFPISALKLEIIFKKGIKINGSGVCQDNITTRNGEKSELFLLFVKTCQLLCILLDHIFQ